jgi:NDP-sugar pyrophosphorylase family protein
LKKNLFLITGLTAASLYLIGTFSVKEKDVLEKESFKRILKDRELNAFKHTGFWRCMDTYKDNLELNDLWKKNKAAWKINMEKR